MNSIRFSLSFHYIDYRGFKVKDLWKLKEMKIEFDFRKAAGLTGITLFEFEKFS